MCACYTCWVPNIDTCGISYLRHYGIPERQHLEINHSRATGPAAQERGSCQPQDYSSGSF